VTVSDLCRREGIKPGVFYAWTKELKEFMEAGKGRLTRDTVRDATRQEIEHLKRENHDGRTTTEEPRRKNHDGNNWLPTFPCRSTASKNGHPSFRRGRRRMRAQERSNVITRVEETRWGKRELLTQLRVPKSNYYRWRARGTAREARQLYRQYPDSLEQA